MTPWLTALVLARALDATSTCMGLAQGRVEMNHIMPTSCQGAAVAQLGMAGAQVVILSVLAKKRPTLSKWLAGIQIGVSSGAVVWNWHIMLK